MESPADCPCGSGRPFEACCGPCLSGERPAATAEAMLRSRYTAFTRGDVDYICRTVHQRQRRYLDAEGIRRWATESTWRGLEILSTRGGGESDESGEVEFVARYEANGELVEHHERSEFRREGGEWRFYDGKLVGREPFVRDAPKVGRNDPCPCGSGKKHKKCCGK